MRSEQVVHHVSDEIRVFIIEKERQADGDAQEKEERLPPLASEPRQKKPCQVPGQDHRQEKNQEESAGLVVEEQTHHEKEGVPEENPVAEKTQDTEHNRQEGPEVALGEQKRMSLIESEKVLQIVKRNFCELRHNEFLFRCSTYFSIRALYSRSPSRKYPSSVKCIRLLYPLLFA